ncbi:MAG: hypothetical protein ABIQ60_05750 [Burkholderiaceae bacterium]
MATRTRKAPAEKPAMKAARSGAKSAPEASTARFPQATGTADASEMPDDDDDAHERIFSRPDGYYWQALDGHQEIGPFESFAEAQDDMDSGDTPDWLRDESLTEAERDVGIADWIDPETGEPAEGQGRPHLDRE